MVLLDEYQDTSVAQRLLLTALFVGVRPGHPVTAVGDPCQAIYGWRGASVGNIDAFPLHGGTLDDVEQRDRPWVHGRNYRSFIVQEPERAAPAATPWTGCRTGRASPSAGTASRRSRPWARWAGRSA